MRAIRESDFPADAVGRTQYRHFMLKEIPEHFPSPFAQTLEERPASGKLLASTFGPSAQRAFEKV